MFELQSFQLKWNLKAFTLDILSLKTKFPRKVKILKHLIFLSVLRESVSFHFLALVEYVNGGNTPLKYPSWSTWGSFSQDSARKNFHFLWLWSRSYIQVYVYIYIRNGVAIDLLELQLKAIEGTFKFSP